MKKRLVGILLILTVIIGSFSSCLLIDGGAFQIPSNDGGTGGTTINVQGGPNYNIDISPNSSTNMIAASKALLSSVSITTSTSAGSGVIYKLNKEKGDAYIITNYHVVYDNASINSEIYAYLYGMEAKEYAIPATYVGGSMNYDIAVLKVTGSTILMESNAIAVGVADSNDVAILDTAIAIGNPEGNGISATVGCINVDSENISVGFQVYNKVQRITLRVMRTDAAVNSGNSGGGLFNDRGELIGIVNAKDADSSTDNIGYAIPSNVAKAIAENIIYYCDGTTKQSVYRCMLGVTVGVDALYTEYDAETGKIYKRETVMLTEVASDAAVNGLLKAGDVINSITIDGIKHEVSRTYHIIDSMLYARVGSSVVINVTRDGTAIDVSVPITESMLTEY
jgi:serine protease Do